MGLVGVLLVLPVLTGAGRLRVEARDGQAWIGEVRFEAGAVVVTPAGKAGAVRVSEGELRRISAATPADIAGATGRLTGLRGEYFADAELALPLFERVDAAPQFEGRGDPGLDLSAMPAAFSVRWTGWVVPPVTGEYRLFAESDDGCRVVLGDVPVVERWGAGARSLSGAVALRAGERVPVCIEYCDVGGGQHLRLEWEAPGLPRQRIDPVLFSPAAPGTPARRESWPERRGGVVATFFAGKGFDRPVPARSEATLSMNFSGIAPAAEAGGGSENWSARFDGRLVPLESGAHRLAIEADDRARVMLDGKEILSTFGPGPVVREAEVLLERDKPSTLVVEFEQDAGAASLRVRWRRPGQAEWEAIPSRALGLPEGEEVPPLVRVERSSVPARFFRSAVGGRRATARVWSAGGGGVERVEWFVATPGEFEPLRAGKPFAVSTPDAEGVATVALSQIPPGDGRLFARAVDGRGRVATSEPLPVEPVGVAAGLVEGPWRDVRVGESTTPLALTREGAGLVLRGESGEVQMQGDVLRLLAQSVSRETQLTARLDEIASDPPGGYALGGLMLRQGPGPEARFVAIGLDTAGQGVVLQRVDTWQAPRAVRVSLRPGMHVRLVRDRESARALVSDDGVAWRTVWTGDRPWDGDSLAGAFAVSRAGTSRLRLSPPTVTKPPEPISIGRGVMLVGGTFLAGDPRLEDAGRVSVRTRDRLLILDRASVAYLAFGAVSPEQAGLLSRRGPCALLRGDEVLDAELARLGDGRATLSSVLFGDRVIDLDSGELRAVAISAFETAPLSAPAPTLRTRDGTTLRGGSIRITPDGIEFRHPAIATEFGPLPPGELIELNR